MSVVLSDHLPLLASTPDGIQKLRGLILELAVRGKLVPQDPNDESASELLKRIAQERARLEAEGVCKKSKPMPPVSKDEQEFGLPEGWGFARVGELTLQVTDGTHHTPKYLPSGVAFISVKDINGLTVSFDDCKYISEEEHQQINQRCNPEKGDILLCRIGTLGRPTIVDTDRRFSLFVSVGLLKLPKNFDFSRYLHLVLASPYMAKQYDKIKAGGSHTNKLNLGDIPKLAVPLPPLAEQHRIVAKVDELMALCDRLEAEQADAASTHVRLVETLLGTLTQSTDAADLAANWQRLAEHFDTLFATEASIDALKQTVLQLAVMGKLVPQDPNDEPASELLKRIAQERAHLEAEGICKKSKAMSVVGEDEQPFAVPDGWTWVRFDEIINPEKPISYGVLVPGPEVADGVPFVRIADLSITDPPALPEKKIDRKVDAQYSRTRLDGGEILMGVVGSIGKLGLAPLSWKGANIARAICRIVPTQHVDKPFVLQLLQSKFMQSSFVGDTRTLAQPTLNVGLIRSALTPVPPLAEQHRIVAKVDELMSLCDRLKADLASARQHQALLADTLIDAALEAA